MLNCRLLLLVAVASASAADFRTTIQPRLVKQGCFSGACHGAGSGQNGFKLSLLGYDPAADYDAIVRQFRGRRVNLVDPAKSLLLRKSTMEIPHGGGQRIEPGSELHSWVIEWIREGAPFEGTARRQLSELRVAPQSKLADELGEQVRIRVEAVFSDGLREDVTSFALFSSNSESIASVSEDGMVTMRGRGETGVSARYMGRFAVARVGARFPGSLSMAASGNFIDGHVNRKLGELGIEPSRQADDSEFVRRVFLDIVGALPSVAETRAFLEDPNADKRKRLVRELLERPEYADYWGFWLLDLVRIRSRTAGEEGLAAFAQSLEAQLRGDVGFDEIVREWITASDGPAVHYLRYNADPKLMAELTTEALMGSRSRCAQCHDHPFDSWTQAQYHRFVSFFVRVKRTEQGIELADHGEIQHPKTGKPVTPGFPDGSEPEGVGPDRRAALADWLTAADNPYFARAFANRVWKRMMGRGLVEPVDDLSASNSSSNPELSSALEEFFREDFSLKRLIAAIASSAAYQRSAEPGSMNAADDRYYSRALARPLGPYRLVDAVAQVTGVAGARAIDQIDPDQESYVLDVCGRCKRLKGCDSDPSGSNLSQMLHLINGELINEKLRDPEGRLARLRSEAATVEQTAEEFYLAALARPASEQELAYWEKQVAEAEDPEGTIEDLVWALLNSRAFTLDR